MDGCHTRLLTPFGQHKKDYTNKNATSSLLLLAITDTCRIRHLVGGFPGSCGDSTALKGRSWYRAMLLTTLPSGHSLPASSSEVMPALV